MLIAAAISEKLEWQARNYTIYKHSKIFKTNT